MKKQRDEAFSAAEKLEGPAKAKALVAALKLLPDDQLSHYGDITEQIEALDPEDESGFMTALNRKQAKTNLEKEYMAAMRSGKHDEAIAMIDKFIANHPIEGEEKQGVLGMKMNPLLAGQQFDSAAELLDELVTIAPESRIGKFANEFKPKLQKMKADAAKPKVNPPHGQPGHIHNE